MANRFKNLGFDVPSVDDDASILYSVPLAPVITVADGAGAILIPVVEKDYYNPNYSRITDVIVRDGGSGYTNGSVVTISSPTTYKSGSTTIYGSGATATVSTSNGAITSVNMTSGGYGYYPRTTATIHSIYIANKNVNTTAYVTIKVNSVDDPIIYRTVVENIPILAENSLSLDKPINMEEGNRIKFISDRTNHLTAFINYLEVN